MAALGAQKPKTAKTQSKVAESAPTYTEWHDLQVNDINRFPLHTTFFTFASGEVSAKGEGDKTQSKNFLSRRHLEIQLGGERRPTSYRLLQG